MARNLVKSMSIDVCADCSQIGWKNDQFIEFLALNAFTRF